ncbi:NCS1 family nucleobase:cation symporter-1 [Extensimonas vulgaris]|uniref:NCS1 family nucleobase:cation symporter-1 n=1 Tax=Extensimonas vulgaris TaxID=1031594 RepID=A0A369AGT1_9BURK|nr:NCS1 family nucleobase:cation symporter-1 [Extensimonas vulgaris]RCX07357.1 NCS1 family nucleobase:cation symporter-1 [Extensimonas vulgaris]TWI34835.1 NCS1 family nucleobase:cation symporter-1 [Extensimonas vulgaris]TXD12832.1 NCS1 family nucleobase:cation symporter-1 [Extensimonas vulgaris]
MNDSSSGAIPLAGQERGVSGDALTNEDLLPTTAAQRHWDWKDYAALWVGMVVCVPTYTMASSMLDQGFTWQMAVWLVFLANCIVLVPMVLLGRVGPRYGVPFPVLARVSFGVKGANLPAVLRGLVACGWFAINCYFGALALHGFLNVLGMNLAGPAPGQTISSSQFLCFLAFWAVHIWFIWRGPESIRRLEVVAAPLMIVASVVLVAVLLARVPAAQLFNLPAKVVEGGPRTWGALTGLVGFWATLALNIPDFTRFAKSQKDQVLGQAIGLPIPMALFSMVGVIGFSASAILYGKAELFPDGLLTKMGPIAAGLGLLVILLANLTTNVAANLVSPSYDFSQIAPDKISFRTGGIIAALLGLLFMPWKLLASSGNYLFTWLGGYGTLLGAIAGILLADYYLVRRGQLQVEDLYRRGGAYEYRNGWNPQALVAFVLGVLPCLPGYLAVSGVIDKAGIPAIWLTLFDAGWFFSLAVAGAYYYLTAKKS